MSALLVTIWELGEAAGPLLIAPLSEVFGRYPVMNGCNIAFIAATILALSSQSSKVFIAARMLTGLAVASNVLNPAIIGDMFESDHRGSAMSLIMLAPLIGGAIGPAISGAIAQTMGWRQIIVISVGLAVLCEVLFLFCFRETYKMAILRRRIAVSQQNSHDQEDTADEELKQKDAMKLWHSITRPFSVLFGSSVLMLLSIFASVSYSYFYVVSVTLPGILEDTYGFTPAQTGSAFISFSKFSSIFSIPQTRDHKLTAHRWRFIPWCASLQLRTRQDLHQTSWPFRPSWKARVPSPAFHCWSLRASVRRHELWLDSRARASCVYAFGIGRPRWILTAAVGSTAIRVRCGCLWNLHGFGDDWCYCDEMPCGYLFPLDDCPIG